MRRFTGTLLAAALLMGGLVAVDSEAGWLDKFKKADGDSDERSAASFDRYPAMDFHQGVLQRDGWRGWTLDGLDIQLMPDCVVYADGENPDKQAAMAEGRPALVTGPRVGDTIIAWRVRIMKPDWEQRSTATAQKVQWSESDPTVGKGEGPQ